ncbi:uncharacterized protein LODBEIA_P32000 [Lodderomyces beijingensis]|uniref:BHLH domain-containing protein n=1 Tax=Lodderomyces beijingensis TaxID=1775926 RepID=A0ABP0ZPC3_9ASCO
MTLTAPPVLKTTIIQLNKELDPEESNGGYEVLTNEYSSNNSNNNNSESKSYSDNNDSEPTSPNLESMPSKKKRRRSTANIDSEELAKRKNETKQLHSIIEKRRRIKINREFEALKYLIPACRNCYSTTGTTPSAAGTPGGNNSSTTTTNKKAPANSSLNNGNKIDGMYKLTILKSSVEYILYLHHIIEKQHQLLRQHGIEGEDFSQQTVDMIKHFDIDFAKIPLDVNQYRNIDIDFNFKDLADLQQLPSNNAASDVNTPIKYKKRKTHSIVEENEDEEEDEGEGEADNERELSEDDDNNTFSSRSSSIAPSSSSLTTTTAAVNSTTTMATNTANTTTSGNSQRANAKPLLPTPDFTPDMAPILTMLNKYTGTNDVFRSGRKISNPTSPQTMVLKSANPSPFTIPLKSSLSNQSPNSFTPSSSSSSLVMGSKGFINSNSSSSSSSNSGKFTLPDPALNPSSNLNDVPRNKIFKSKLTSDRNSLPSMMEEELEVGGSSGSDKISDSYASKTLLALRKSSIDSLLN